MSESGTITAREGVAGELIVVRRSEPGRGLMEVEAVCSPGPAGVEERAFESHDVRFEVLEGRLMIGVEGAVRTLRCGEALRVPAGIHHRIWVEPGSGEARFIWQMRPAPGEELLAGGLAPLVLGPATDQTIHH